MENKIRFMAQELPENEMDMLYSLLDKEPVKKERVKQKSRLWSWRTLIE